MDHSWVTMANTVYCQCSRHGIQRDHFSPGHTFRKQMKINFLSTLLELISAASGRGRAHPWMSRQLIAGPEEHILGTGYLAQGYLDSALLLQHQHTFHLLSVICVFWGLTQNPPFPVPVSLQTELLHTICTPFPNTFIDLSCHSRTFVSWSIYLHNLD